MVLSLVAADGFAASLSSTNTQSTTSGPGVDVRFSSPKYNHGEISKGCESGKSSTSSGLLVKLVFKLVPLNGPSRKTVRSKSILGKYS